MKKIFLVLLFFISSCGYQSIYLNKSLKNYEFKKITYEGDKNINRKIINFLSIEENEANIDKNEIFIKSSYQIKEISKDSKGQVTLYKDIISVNINIKDEKNLNVKNKKFNREFTYNNKDNKFDLVEYQNSIKDDLLKVVINDIIIFLNTE